MASDQSDRSIAPFPQDKFTAGVMATRKGRGTGGKESEITGARAYKIARQKRGGCSRCFGTTHYECSW